MAKTNLQLTQELATTIADAKRLLAELKQEVGSLKWENRRLRDRMGYFATWIERHYTEGEPKLVPKHLVKEMREEAEPGAIC